MANLRQITLHFDTHDAVVTPDHIVRVDVEHDLIGDPESNRTDQGLPKGFKLGPAIVTIVVEAENMTSYVRPATRRVIQALPDDDHPRKLLRRRNPA